VLTVALVGPDNCKELTPDGDGVGDGVGVGAGAPLDLLSRYTPPTIAVTVIAPITIAVPVFILTTFFIFCHFLILLK
jgi:Na+/H+-translocating membrane pyrophosphatase